MTSKRPQTTYRLPAGAPPTSRRDRHSGRTVVAAGLCAAAVAGMVVAAAIAVGTRGDAAEPTGTSGGHSPPTVAQHAPGHQQAQHPGADGTQDLHDPSGDRLRARP
jgi:hypothetical protein